MKRLSKREVKNTIKMIKTMLTVVVVALVVAMLMKGNTTDTTYYRSAEVTEVRGTVCYLTDTQGNVWSVDDDSLRLYARYTLLMDSQATDDVTDDVIVEIQ